MACADGRSWVQGAPPPEGPAPFPGPQPSHHELALPAGLLCPAAAEAETGAGGGSAAAGSPHTDLLEARPLPRRRARGKSRLDDRVSNRHGH